MDEDVWHELNYQNCLKLEKKEEAITSLEFLIKKYSENVDYMKEYMKISDLSPRELYKKMNTQFKSKIAKIYEISFIEDAD